MIDYYPLNKYKLVVDRNDLINSLFNKHPNLDDSKIVRALDYIEAKFDGVTRKSGEPYVCHCIRAALALCRFDIVLDEDIVVAALLHDVIEDCNVNKDKLASVFGSFVADIVDGVTQVSRSTDTCNGSSALTKEDVDKMSDEKMLLSVTKDKRLARYIILVKFADRFDNEMTISSMPRDKQLNKVFHSRDIIIPLLKMIEAYRLVDVLEELGYRINHYTQYLKLRDLVVTKGVLDSDYATSTIRIIENTFSSKNKRLPKKAKYFAKNILSLEIAQRSFISFFRYVSNYANNIDDDMRALIWADSTPHYDVMLVFNDEVCGTYLTPRSIVRDYFGEYLDRNGITIEGNRRTSNGDSTYLLLRDKNNRFFRLFCRTASEYKTYCCGTEEYGDNDTAFAVDHYEPRSSFHKIKCFKKDGSAISIDEHSSCLDFAYAIHTYLGDHFAYATINDEETHFPAYHLLSPGDKVVIHKNDDVTPQLAWFRYCVTAKAKNKLIKHFQSVMQTD